MIDLTPSWIGVLNLVRGLCSDSANAQAIVGLCEELEKPCEEQDRRNREVRIHKAHIAALKESGEFVDYRCPECGSEVTSDASAAWDTERQEWSLAGVQDQKYCTKCDWEGLPEELKL